MFADFQAGQKVIFTFDIERFPLGIFRAGETGRVVSVNRQGGIVEVCMDKQFDWLKDWNNCLVWTFEDERSCSLSDYIKVIEYNEQDIRQSFEVIKSLDLIVVDVSAVDRSFDFAEEITADKAVERFKNSLMV